MKKIFLFIICFAIVLAITACDNGEKILVGVSMPTADSSDRWGREGELIKAGLKKAGYDVDLQYGDNTFATQMLQIENMINAGVKALVITAVDSNTLKTILQTAAKAEIFVILHDRMIYDTPYITAFSTYNDMYIGAWQASYIIAALELDSTNSKFNMEIFSGPEDDECAYMTYSGAVAILGAYIDDGKLNVVSGQRNFEDTNIKGWDRTVAYERMKSLLETYYKTEDIDVVLAGSDSIAAGIIDALDEAGKSYPIIITGQNAETYGVKNIIDGKQTMSVFKDYKTIADRTVTLVDQILRGVEVETNRIADNGSKEIPTYESPLSIVDIVSYKEVLIDSGYYKASDFE